MIEYVLVAGTLVLLIVSIARAGLVPFPTVFIALLTVSEVVFVLNHDYSYATFDMLAVISRGGLRQNYTITLVVYTAAAFFSLLAAFGRFSQLRNLRVDNDTLQKLAEKKYVGFGIYALLGVLALHLALFLFVTDWNLLWRSAGYLLPIMDSESIRSVGGGVAGTVSRSLLPVVILAAIGLYATVHLGKSLLIGPYAAICIFHFLVLFSLHSRSAAIVPLFIAATHYLLGRRFRRTVVLLLIVASLLSLACALQGRGRYHAQGFASIPLTIEGFFNADPTASIGNIFVNLSEGIFSVAESLQIDKPFSTRYMLLAFSPLPSFIDGYAYIRATDEHRLHFFAPMSGIGEAIAFGLPFVFLLAMLYATAIRLHLRLVERRPLVFIVCNSLILFSSYHILAYPIRNGLRYLWLAILIAVLFGRSRPKVRALRSRPDPRKDVRAARHGQ